MECKEFYFKGKEDLDIHVYKWTDKNIEPKAVVQIAHGMSETAIRYKEFAEKLTKITVRIEVKAGENGKIFGGVSAKDISENLDKQHQIKVDKKKIDLKETFYNG